MVRVSSFKETLAGCRGAVKEGQCDVGAGRRGGALSSNSQLVLMEAADCDVTSRGRAEVSRTHSHVIDAQMFVGQSRCSTHTHEQVGTLGFDAPAECGKRASEVDMVEKPTPGGEDALEDSSDDNAPRSLSRSSIRSCIGSRPGCASFSWLVRSCCGRNDPCDMSTPDLGVLASGLNRWWFSLPDLV